MVNVLPGKGDRPVFVVDEKIEIGVTMQKGPDLVFKRQFLKAEKETGVRIDL